MKVISTLWGLIFDDSRLVIGLMITLVVTALFKYIHLNSVSPYVIFVGVVVSLWISVEHQLRLKRK